MSDKLIKAVFCNPVKEVSPFSEQTNPVKAVLLLKSKLVRRFFLQFKVVNETKSSIPVKSLIIPGEALDPAIFNKVTLK